MSNDGARLGAAPAYRAHHDIIRPLAGNPNRGHWLPGISAAIRDNLLFPNVAGYLEVEGSLPSSCISTGWLAAGDK